MAKSVIQNTKNNAPLVHLISNYVTANDCANLCLSVGAHPIMADCIREVREITSRANALVLNMGILNEQKVESMMISAKEAVDRNIPIILDPVGIGASTYRYESLHKLLSQVAVSVIRGNFSEIEMLAYGESDAVGVDAYVRSLNDNIEAMIAISKLVSDRYECIVAVTGETDIIVFKDDVTIIQNGQKLMSKVTGTGCMLSSLIGCYLAANDNAFNAVVSAVCVMGISGELAYERMDQGDGIASYKRYLLDAVYNITDKNLEEGANIEYRKIKL